VLANAILGRNPRHGHRGHGRAAARVSARRLRAPHSAVRLVVDSRGAAAARAILRAQGLKARAVRTPGRVSFSIANRADESGDEAVWARELAGALQRGRVPVVMFRAP